MVDYGDGFAILVGDEVWAVTQQMDNVGLNHCVREHGGDRFTETLKSGDNGD